MSLTKQHAAFLDQSLRQRINAAIARHAVFLINKASPTAAETAWAKAVLGNEFNIMLDRAMRYIAAKPAVYGAPIIADITDDALIALVQEAQAKLVPLPIEERQIRG